MNAGPAGPSSSACDTQMTSSTAHGRATAVHWWVPAMALASFSFLLHFLWEMLQVPLYADMASMAHWSGVVVCAKATAGDVAIALTAYATVAAFWRTWHWRDSCSHTATYLATGIAITVLFEWLNVYVWQSWAYATAMPLVFGIGVGPLLQWVIVPPLARWLMQRHIAGDHRMRAYATITHAPSLSRPRN